MDYDDPRNPNRIPKATIEDIQRYVDKGQPPGGFVEAVLSNNLMEACKRADTDNLDAIVAIAQYVYSHVPLNCHGSKDIVNLWCALATATRENAPAAEIDQISNELYEALGRKGM